MTPDASGSSPEQLGLFGSRPAVVHYFDRNGALRSGHLVRWVKRGRHRGKPVVLGAGGRKIIPEKIRNVQYLD